MNATERMYDLMRKEHNRLKTFQMNPTWPKDYVDIRKLAKAGFFYAFNGDNVHCAFCRGQVCQWERGDEPMTEHARHFTTCPFIMGGEVGNVPLGEDPFPGPKRPRPYDVCGIHQAPEDTREREPLQQSDQWQSLRQYPSEISAEITLPQQLYNIHPNLDQMSRLQTSSVHQPQGACGAGTPPSLGPQHQQMPSVDQHQSLNTQNESSIIQNNLDACNSLNSNSSGSSLSSNSLAGICKICYTNSIELVFLPCGHSVSCLSCAQRLHGCPFCRATITTRIRTFLV